MAAVRTKQSTRPERLKTMETLGAAVARHCEAYVAKKAGPTWWTPARRTALEAFLSDTTASPTSARARAAAKAIAKALDLLGYAASFAKQCDENEDDTFGANVRLFAGLSAGLLNDPRTAAILRTFDELRDWYPRERIGGTAKLVDAALLGSLAHALQVVWWNVPKGPAIGPRHPKTGERDEMQAFHTMPRGMSEDELVEDLATLYLLAASVQVEDLSSASQERMRKGLGVTVNEAIDPARKKIRSAMKQHRTKRAGLVLKRSRTQN
jgi:hypothetical protein